MHEKFKFKNVEFEKLEKPVVENIVQIVFKIFLKWENWSELDI